MVIIYERNHREIILDKSCIFHRPQSIKLFHCINSQDRRVQNINKLYTNVKIMQNMVQQ